MTAREFRRFRERNKLSVKDIATILMQSEESIYAKLRGTRMVNNRDSYFIDQYSQVRQTAINKLA
jgi:hypothetical protein